MQRLNKLEKETNQLDDHDIAKGKTGANQDNNMPEDEEMESLENL